MQSDYAIARAAEYLGYAEDAAALDARAVNYGLLFDESTGFFRSKTLTSYLRNAPEWSEPFDEFAWGSDYTEGGPWQFRFYVPYVIV
jgi:putative alpha-1,2-mannosidase